MKIVKDFLCWILAFSVLLSALRRWPPCIVHLLGLLVAFSHWQVTGEVTSLPHCWSAFGRGCVLPPKTQVSAGGQLLLDCQQQHLPSAPWSKSGDGVLLSLRVFNHPLLVPFTQCTGLQSFLHSILFSFSSESTIFSCWGCDGWDRYLIKHSFYSKVHAARLMS